MNKEKKGKLLLTTVQLQHLKEKRMELSPAFKLFDEVSRCLIDLDLASKRLGNEALHSKVIELANYVESLSSKYPAPQLSKKDETENTKLSKEFNELINSLEEEGYWDHNEVFRGIGELYNAMYKNGGTA